MANSDEASIDSGASIRCLMIGVVLIAGCAARTGSRDDPSRARFQQESDEITARENQCLDSAAAKLAQRCSETAATIDAFTEFSLRSARSDFYWEAWQCTRVALRENEKAAARERAQYGHEQNQGRENSTLMGMLLSSRPH